MSMNGPERSRGTVYGAPENAPAVGAFPFFARQEALLLNGDSEDTQDMTESWKTKTLEIQKGNSELQRVQAMAMGRLKDDNARLSAELTAMKDSQAKLEATVEDANRMNQELARQAASFKNNHERALGDMESLRAVAETHETERAALQRTQEELRAAKAETATLAARVQELKGAASELSSKHADVASAHAIVTEQLGVEKEKHGALVDQHNTLLEKHNELQAQVAITQENAAETRADLEATRGKLEAAEEKLRRLGKAHETMAADHAALKTKHADHVDKHEALVKRHDALVAKSRSDKSELAEHIEMSSALEKQDTELKAKLAACNATSTAASAAAKEQRAANAEALHAAELLETRASDAEARLEATLRQRDAELKRLKEAYESEKVSLQKEIGVCASQVDQLHSTHLEHVETTKDEKEKLSSSNSVLYSENRSLKDRHIKFVNEAIELITLLNLQHGFTPRMDPSGKIELSDMVEQLRAA
jgi:chromosome segregation ATPase